ncbi:hypothetical protein [Mesorhizobium sp.]|uniref:hypothetical protein n=1 Tax=Mesorhizobium sp. TaxID=1871066 RepID=UPI000FE6BF03|nr:hypothetical protein [Mesorhizobium sp.]RWF66846.1 MAG: hypothetical protein EOS47_04470 [Mesorhizobium sp.]
MSDLSDTPAGMISRLDASLARHGTDAKLRRLTLGPNSLQIPFDCDVKASVLPLKADELVGSIDQAWSRVIISPTLISAAQWPLPIKKGDKIVQNGKVRNVEFVKPIMIQNIAVRFELLVGG